MKAKFLSFLFVVTCLCSCSSRSSQYLKEGNCPSLDLISACPEVKDLSSYIKDVQLFPLSSDSVFIARTPKLLHYDSKIIILSDKLYEFNSDGSFSKIIGRQGRGPGEYVHLNDVALDLENNQLLGLTHQNILLRFSLATGETEQEQQLDIKASTNGLIPLSGGRVAVFVANPPQQDTCAYRLLVFDKNGALTDKALPSQGDFSISMGFRQFVYQVKDNSYALTFSPSSCNTYLSDGEKMTPSAYLDFGSKALPEDFFSKFNDPWQGVAEAFGDDSFKSPIALETDHLTYVNAYGKDSSMWNFVTNGKKGLRWRSIPDTAAPMQAVCSDGEYLYFVFTEAELSSTEDLLKKYLIEKCSVRLSPDDNPIIVKVKFAL